MKVEKFVGWLHFNSVFERILYLKKKNKKKTIIYQIIVLDFILLCLKEHPAL